MSLHNAQAMANENSLPSELTQVVTDNQSATNMVEDLEQLLEEAGIDDEGMQTQGGSAAGQS